ncbi:MAG: sodium:calcium antiporter, partial [Euryarchaeota archaeon]|nr:sodium:calcium antiporter [Euryarchaeota archaeon]
MVTPWVWVGLILPAFFVLNEGAKLVTDSAAIMARRSGRSKFVIGILLVSTLGALPEVLV